MSGTPQETALLKFWIADAAEWRRRTHLSSQAKGDDIKRRPYRRRRRSLRPLPRSTRPVARQAARS
ncbi:MAG TPA: hypothetical protein VMQ54_11980, partial [Steroidobacteraceae bacterium]|nr:hypothetical protein [Steroidobacteraceae bacterium]